MAYRDFFITALLVKFGLNAYNDPNEAFTQLRQNETIEEYKEMFETLSNRLRGLFGQYKLSCFLIDCVVISNCT